MRRCGVSCVLSGSTLRTLFGLERRANRKIPRYAPDEPHAAVTGEQRITLKMVPRHKHRRRQTTKSRHFGRVVWETNSSERSVQFCSFVFRFEGLLNVASRNMGKA